MNRAVSVLVGLATGSIVLACGAGGSGTNGGTSAGDSGAAASATPTCLDGSGNVTSACAVTPNANICPLGDANHCLSLTKLEVYADDGKNGVCVHLVFANECPTEVFADTCIALVQANTDGFKQQCWTSSVDVGTIDVSACHATGDYFSVATESSGQLPILEAKCPAPTP